jgi:hypothetical protein
MHAILGLLLVLAAVGALAGVARGASCPSVGGLAAVARRGGSFGSPYRVGPWPGLTWRGAGVLVVCAGMLVGGELIVGSPSRAWPDLVWLGLVDVAPPLVATCLVLAPGCTSAVCGVYLLGRSLASLVEPSLELPPLLLPSAVACDLAVWLRRADLRWPTRQVWRRRSRVQRGLTAWRAAFGGLAFGVVLALVEPPFRLLLGSDPSGWAASQQLLAAVSAGVGCALAGAALERITNRPRPSE